MTHSHASPGRAALRRLAVCLPLAAASAAYAQAPEQPVTRLARPEAEAPEPGALVLEPVVVTAEKQEENLQDVPQSITVLTGDTIREANIRDVRDVGYRVPNLTVQQFTAPRLSFLFVRGIGSGRNNPAVTTYIDDVPQLSFATSNIEFVGLDRIEVLRGPQGTLYGRNTLGGVINVYTEQPTNRLEFESTADVGTYALQDYRGSVKGPVIDDRLFFTLAGGYLSRNGFTENDVTREKIDDRDHLFGRAGLRFTPDDRWDVRLTLSGQRDRDGDFALFDLASLVARPRHVLHDFTGLTERDVTQVALTARYAGDAVDFVSISALQHWRSREVTDLDASPLDLIRRNNRESQQNFIQEFRLGSAKDRPLPLGDDLALTWIVGTFFFASDTNQFAFNNFRPGAVGVIPQIFFPFRQFETSDLGDYGIAAFGQATLTVREKLDLTAGVRYDYEHKEAELGGFGSSPLIPVTSLEASDDFDQVSPRFQAAYHLTDDVMAYASAAKGFKAGGFSTNAPPGQAAFDPETSWSYEAGVKATLFGNRLRVNADYFYIDWDDLQLDTPTGAPGVFFIDNAGRATSHGAELEAAAVVVSDPRGVGTVELFGGAGVLNTNFGGGSFNQGQDVGGNALPFAPDFTANVGAQYSRALAGDTVAYAWAEAFSVGQYFYDASNAAGQDAYTLANFRVGVGGEAGRVGWRVEAFLNNAFNAEYVPLAFPFALAPSGYVGESGAPQVAGVTVGVQF